MSFASPLQLKSGSTLTDFKQYRRALVLLQYLAFTRPDISFAVNRLSQFMHSPSVAHWQTVKRLLRYIKGTIDYSLYLRCSCPLHLSEFSDSDWGSIHDGGRSTTANVLYLGPNIISWKSAKQKCVSQSSTKADDRAAANATAELIMNHLAHDFFFVHDIAESGQLKVSQISTKLQITNVLTQRLGKDLFEKFRSKLGVSSGTSILWGSIRT
ncbi:hypothetical protein LXL04_023762 [Taraxacum kok-saghyz]